MALTREVKFAIIGHDGIGAYHADYIARTENVKLVAVADIVADRAKAAGQPTRWPPAPGRTAR